MIGRFGVALLASLLLSGGALADPAFEAFLPRFRAAVATGDAAGLADLTRLPFVYEGKPHDRAAFTRIMPVLFDAPVRRCLAAARPLVEDDAQVVFCPPLAFYFRKGDDGRYRLDEFAADGEDAP